MGLLAATLAVLTVTGVVQVWQIYLVAFCLGLVTVVDNPDAADVRQRDGPAPRWSAMPSR